jgi:hypothetical protein
MTRQTFYKEFPMIKLALSAIAAASMAVVATPAFAHPDGDQDYRPQRKPIAELAKDAVVKLVTQSKLPASWAKVDASGSDLRPKEGKPQWVVTFENPQIKNASKRMLYVTMTGTGEFVSASHKPV